MFPWKQPGSRSRDLPSGRYSALLVAWLVISMGLPIVSAHGQSDEQRVEQFLTRLGLVDLQILQLEQSLARSPSSQEKQQTARRLADLYAERLIAMSDDKPRYDETVGRIMNLLSAVPEANTTALQVMLLQADYNRAESLISTWISEPQEAAARGEAQQILTRITPQLVEHQRVLKEQVAELAKQLEGLPEGDELQSKEQESRRVQNVAARATYFAAWANYYLGLVNTAAIKAEPYVQARDIFLHLMGFEEGLPEELEPEWLGLESIWRARSMIGLGLSEAACGNLDASQRCFAALQHPSVPVEIQDQAPYWQVRALLNAGEYARADAFARPRVESFQPPPTQGKVSLCVALFRAGFSPPAPADGSPQRALGNLGLVGLARLGQLHAINTLLEKFQVVPSKDAGFVLLWATGQQQFAQAEKSHATTDYETALATLQRALQTPEVNTLAGPAARCRYTLGWCFYRLERGEEAAREFVNAFPALHESKDPLAVETAWMAMAAYLQLAADQPRFVTLATDALKRLEQHYPEHAYAQRGRYELNKLLEKTDPQRMVQQLSAVASTDPQYPLARYDLCLLLHRMWSQQKDNPSAGLAQLEALRAAAEVYLQQVTTNTDAMRKLTVSLLAADAALHQQPPQREIAHAMLTAAGPHAAQLPETNPRVLEYHFRLLEVAAAEGNSAARQQQAQWLVEHARGSAYEQPALVIMANALDQDIREAAGDGVAALNQQAYDLYRRLLDVLTTSDQSLAGSKNAQIAASRLSHYAQQTGQAAEAARILEQLLQVAPRDRRYLQRAATAHALAGQHDLALKHWRTLLSGLASGSEDWYEAKYHQLQSLSQIDKDQARKVFEQLQLLHPDLGGERWQGKFTELARSW